MLTRVRTVVAPESDVGFVHFSFCGRHRVLTVGPDDDRRPLMPCSNLEPLAGPGPVGQVRENRDGGHNRAVQRVCF